MPDSLTSELESDFVCDCDVWVRSACVGEPFYKEHGGKRYCVLHFPGKEKSADFEQALQRKLENEDYDFRGVWFPDELSFINFEFGTEANFNSATFSAAAYFGNATFNAEASFHSATFSAKADFSSATFNAEASFGSATFNALAYFGSATFNAEASFGFATFSAEAYFHSATFSAEAYFRSAAFSAEANFSSAALSAEANFSLATFSAEANFSLATFSAEANFSLATFSAEVDFRSDTFSAKADFSSAAFSAEANFSLATFSAEADFNSATFADHLTFAGAAKHQVFTDASRLDLQFARIEKPDRVSFHTLSLRPHWFVNIDARKFGFTNVNWGRLSINAEISRLDENNISSPHPLLAIAYRNLAVNSEENHRYEEASKFRYMAMEARRLEGWRGFAPWRLSWWYWLASGYGERVWQAAIVLVILWLMFASLYFIGQRSGQWWRPTQTQTQDTSLATTTKARADEIPRLIGFRDSLVYSLGVMTLQKPEPQPANKRARTLVLLETILGPVQAALLALAIRRKFMR